MDKFNVSKLLLVWNFTMAVFLHGQVGHAQETICPAIAPGPDAGGVVTCEGQVTLSATTGLDNYRWGKYTDGGEQILNANGGSAVIDKSSFGSGIYWWETVGEVHGENLIKNGDFEGGNSGFGSEYGYVRDRSNLTNELGPEGMYSITSSPNRVHANFCNGRDHTPGNGNMMVVNGAPEANQKVWFQTINVLPNTNYVFSVYFTSVHASNPGQLRFSIGGTQIGADIILSELTCSWEQFYTIWNSGANDGEMEISIVNQNINANGNDFALDGILFAEACTYREDIEVQFLDPATADQIEVSNDPVCEGSEAMLVPTYTDQASTGFSVFSWYKDPSKTNPIADGTDQDNPPVSYEIGLDGKLTVSGLGTGEYTYYVSVQNETRCENDSGNLKEVKIAVKPQPPPPEVSVLGGHPRNI